VAAVNLIGSYNYALVALSVVIAIFASYAALDLAGRVTAASGWTRAVWLLGGAGAMGIGIWSMHYIGMLAFILPIPVAYHWPTVLLSLFAAILASAVALGVVSRRKMGWFRALAGSVLMGAGIASMHYIGMAAMRLPAVCQFNSFLVALSVVFAVLISLAALWITFHFRDEKKGIGWEKLAGAVVMGAAIPVMHYTGMAAASFTPSGMPADLSHAVSISTLGTAGIAAVTFIVLGLALLTSSVDRRFAAQTLEVQEEKLQRNEAFLAEAQSISHTGSFGWRPSTGEILWSEETFRIFQYDRATRPTVELILQRVHPEDAASVKQTIERAAQDGKDFEHEYRLVMPDGSVKHVHVVAHAERDESGEGEIVGAVMDVSDRKRAEEELRSSEALAEQRLRLVVDTTPAMINSCRPDGHLDYVNKGWLDYFGFSLETALDRADVMKMSAPSDADMRGGNWQPVIHPEDLQGFTGSWKATLASGKPGEHEARVRRFDGVYRWHLFRAVPLYDQTGKPIKWYASAFDIEDRKRAEALLAGEKRLLQMIARSDSRQHVLEGACLLVEELATGSLCSILLLDSSANCLRHGAAPSLPKTYTEAIDGAIIGPSVGSCGTAAYRAETVIVSDIATDLLWADFRDLASAHELRACWSTPILSSAGKVLGTFATYYREPRNPSSQELNVIERITHLASIAIERKQADEKLRQSEAYLAEAQRLSHTGSWAGAPGMGEIRYWSEECYRVLGFDPHAGQPRVETFFRRIHPEDQAWTIEQLERAGREKREFEFDYRIVHPGGEIRSIHTVGHPVLSPSGDLVEFVGTVIDVTERKRAEEERERLRQAQADLARVNRVTTMGELTASLAHEVNQPIAAALTNANTCLRWLTRDLPDVEEARAAAMRIVKDQTRAAEIVSRIRMVFNKGIPQREWVDVNEVIREMIALLRGEITRFSISVRTELAADLPQVMGDHVQLQQVLMNLMINGIDAMKDVEGTRELGIKSQRAQSREVVVSVTDTGVGLPPHQAEQIFNAFFTTKSHGTGMGLRISRSIVESHGGRLWAADNPPCGASFYFTLPTRVEADE
jgi:PAS domain S-box-containing protein